MNTRSVSLTNDDISGLETELKQKAASLTDEQKQFSSYLIKRAKAGRESAPKADAIMWTWTYRF